jgi:NADH dehydrogenase [ubiquinone] 1 alpha subcomplex assembly factor 5
MPQNTVPPQARIFDRRLLRDRRGRAAGDLHAHDFLLTEIAERLADRFSDIARRFPVALDLGARDGILARTLQGRGGIETLIQSEASLVSARRGNLVADEELLPFREQSFDAILSNLALHWVNDLPGALAQIRSSLKPDGLFLASLFGTGTLQELRTALMEAELAETGGASPRVSPFADLRDAAGLLQRAGFALPVADAEDLRLLYADRLALLRELRAAGETNALRERDRRVPPRALFPAALAALPEAAGRAPVTLRLAVMTGWA